jgi:hypothetical protein
MQSKALKVLCMVATTEEKELVPVSDERPEQRRFARAGDATIIIQATSRRHHRVGAAALV